MWEPVLEPVDCTDHGIINQRPNEFNVEAKKYSSTLDVALKSNDIMELTITYSFLDALFALNETFWGAGKQLPFPLHHNQPPPHQSSYIVQNQLDTNVVVHFESSDLAMDDSSLTSLMHKVIVV